MKEAISLLIAPSDFYTFTLGEAWQNKINTIHFQIARALRGRSNFIASIAKHLNFQEKTTFAKVFWVKRGKTK